MEARELRINNWIEVICNDHLTPDCNIECNRHHLKDIIKGSDYYSYKPIPLTEEWLFKFGAIKIGDEDWILEDSQGWEVHLLQDNKGFMFCFDNNNVRVEYIHSLQNLFFALTQEELTIKQE